MNRRRNLRAESAGDVDVAPPVAYWNDDVHVVDMERKFSTSITEIAQLVVDCEHYVNIWVVLLRVIPPITTGRSLCSTYENIYSSVYSGLWMSPNCTLKVGVPLIGSKPNDPFSDFKAARKPRSLVAPVMRRLFLINATSIR